MMNRKIIFLLSLFGAAMGFATVTIISSAIEPVFWLIIFIFCAVVIAKQCHSKYFLHGFLVSLLNSVWITMIHIVFYESYIAYHPQELQMMEKFPLPYSMRISMLMIGPVIGIMSGIILGLFCYIASKTIKHKKHNAS
jgi:hypothetical protein